MAANTKMLRRFAFVFMSTTLVPVLREGVEPPKPKPHVYSVLVSPMTMPQDDGTVGTRFPAARP